MVAFVGNAEFLGDFIVVSDDGGEFLFNLGLGGGQVGVEDGQFIDARAGFFVLEFDGLLATESLQNTKKNISKSPQINLEKCKHVPFPKP